MISKLKGLLWPKNLFSEKQLKAAEKRQLYLTVVTSKVLFFSYMAYLIFYTWVDFHELRWLILSVFFFMVLTVFVRHIINMGKYHSARVILVLIASTQLFVATGVFLGNSTGIQIYLLVISLIPLILWSSKHKVHIASLFILNVGLYLLIYSLFSEAIFQVEFPSQYFRAMTVSANVISFIVIALFLGLYQKLVRESEEISNENSKLIEESNQKLNLKTLELTELNKTKDKFLSILAHDLKNPFNSLIVGSELLKTNYTGLTEERKERLIKSIYETAKSTYELLENLLAWGNIQLSNIHLKTETLALNTVIHECLEIFEHSRKEKNIELVLELDEQDAICADMNTLSVVIRNLISNAIKFTPRGGRISIFSSSENDDYLKLTIIDTGIGMSEDQVENLFKIDKKTTREGTDNEKGSGLGIVLCEEYVRKNHGKLEVISKEGEGSRFVLKFRKICD